MSLFSSPARKGLALAVIGASLTVMASSDAEARWRHRHLRGVGVAAAIGGLAAGALIAGAGRSYAAPAYGYSYGHSYAPAYYAPATTYYYDQGPSYYAPAYATPTRYHRRPVYRQRVAYGEPVCTISRKRVWLSHNTYTFRKVTHCR